MDVGPTKFVNMLMLLSCQPRVTVTSCFVYKVIRDLESIDHVYINPIRRIGLIHTWSVDSRYLKLIVKVNVLLNDYKQNTTSLSLLVGIIVPRLSLTKWKSRSSLTPNILILGKSYDHCLSQTRCILTIRVNTNMAKCYFWSQHCQLRCLFTLLLNKYQR